MGRFWDSEQEIIAIDRYYALRNEVDLPLSKVNGYGLICCFPYSPSRVGLTCSLRDSTNICLDFRPPRNPEGMKALFQQSVQNLYLTFLEKVSRGMGF